MVDTELEAFETSIDLRAYAGSQGYVWDKLTKKLQSGF
jgi:hypothetical protein